MLLPRVLVIIIWLSSLVWGGAQEIEGEHFNPSDIVVNKDGSFFVSCSGNNEIRHYSPSGNFLAKQSIRGKPSSIVFAPDKQYLVVTSGQGEGWLTLLDVKNLRIILSQRCGHSPQAPQFSPDGKRLALAQRFKDEVWLLDVKTWTVVHQYAVLRQPIDLKWRTDQRIVVLQHLSNRPADAEWTGCSMVQMDVSTGKFSEITLTDGSSGARKFALSLDGKYALAPMVIGSFRVPATQIERGWINKNGLSVVDLDNNRVLGTLLLDDLSFGAANPWDIQVTAKEAWISLAGIHQLMVVDLQLLIVSLEKMNPEQRENLTYDLGIGRTWKQRLALSGKGPRAMTLSDDKSSLWVTAAFSSSVEKVDLHNREISILVKPQEVEPRRRGEYLFHDASISFQHWMSCSSCHPDARTDGLNWDLPNDGLGSLRQGKTMLFTHFTPPTTITGIRPNAEYSVRAGVIFLRATLSEEDASAIDAYLKQLQPVPSPQLLDDGTLSLAARAGKEIFESKGSCSDCHNGEYLTNQKLRNVGTGLGDESDFKYDVPSLREIWRTAPYLHDGRAASLEDIFKEFNAAKRHGSADTLSAKEFGELMVYLKSL